MQEEARRRAGQRGRGKRLKKGIGKEGSCKLEQTAKARGFYDVVEEYLKLAREAETVDPMKGVAEDKERGYGERRLCGVEKKGRLEAELSRWRLIMTKAEEKVLLNAGVKKMAKLL
ncbi:MAG: PaRep2b protein [Pyrobaculum sp.]|uniref:PaRep2b protein n=1 Tax=Pyrobaculum sp. TaxID=2004705 RepID=UPI003EEB4DE0